MRVFLAITLPEEVRQHLVQVQALAERTLAGEAASFTPVWNIHLTLKFLGEIDPTALTALQESLQLIRRSGPVLLQAQDLECLPQRDATRIVSAGMGGDAAALRGLQRAIEQRCQRLGFSPQQRSFRPHVTLARAPHGLPIETTRSLANTLQSLWPGPSFLARSFQLIRSELRPDGAVYTPLHQFAFTDLESDTSAPERLA